MELIHLLGIATSALALVAACYALMSAAFADRYAQTDETAVVNPAVTLLKPLHGEEPLLERNLESFFVQDYSAPVQIVFGVADEDDKALAAVETLRARYPAADIAVAINARRLGVNPKASNLANMMSAARHDILIASDADIAVPRDYLMRLTRALARPGTGAVTCLYTGIAATGFAAQLSAMGISYHFLPNVVSGTALGLARPCFGATIALRRETLEAIGGFERLAGYLADDYELGRAVRALGLAVAIPTFAVRHSCAEPNLVSWFAHELRWARTIRAVDPAGYVGSFITHAIPLGLLGAIFSGFTLLSLLVLVAGVAARGVLKRRIDRIFGAPAGPFWLLPLRDVLSFAVFPVSLFGRRVEWRGERLSALNHEVQEYVGNEISVSPGAVFRRL
jgi:ceramide glucosyltransferase